MTQLGDKEILIVGGFNGKFLTDCFILECDVDGKPISVKQEGTNNLNLFPFQVPTLGSTKERAVLTIDWQTMALYKYKESKWDYVQHIKN